MGSRTVLAVTPAERQLTLRFRTNRCSAEVVSSVPMDEIATAIARCAGCLADSVATGESIDSGEGRAIHYGGSSKIFFDR